MDFATFAQLVLSGLTIGCVYSLVGLGFALTLKATELINFAQGEMVTLGAFFGLTLVAAVGVPYWLAFVLSTAATGVVGLAMERIVLRPILARKAPLLIPLIATLGVAIALPAIAVMIWGRDPIAYPPLFRPEPIEVFGLRVQLLNLWILGLGFAAMAGLQFFFHRTLAGIGWRAASLDPATAALYGVSRNRNVALTLGLSGALGGGAGVLMAPLFFTSVGLGYSVLIKAFAAAAIGGFGIVGTMFGGLILGVVETLAAGALSAEYKNVITYAILIAILMLFFRPAIPSGRSITETSRMALGRTESALKKRSVQIALAVLVLAVWGAILGLADAYALRVINLALIFAIAALGLQVIVGLTGQFSFGHAAFLGVGAYTSALLTTKLAVPFWIGVPAATIAAAVVGLFVAPILRLSGHFLAIATLAAGEILFLLMLNSGNG
jgi:branched-subunit amino acid ABC-type transport system permease component